MRKSLFIGLLALSSTMIFAQNQEQRIKEPEKITFKPEDVVVLTVSGRGDKDIDTYLG